MTRKIVSTWLATFLLLGASRVAAASPAAKTSVSDDGDSENPLANLPPRASASETPEGSAPADGATTRFRVWKWTATGAAAAALGTGAVFMLRAGDQEQELKKQTAGPYHDGVRALEDGWKQNRLIGYSALIGGGMLAVTSFVLFVKDKPVEARTAIAPIVGPGFAGAAAHVRF